MVEFQKRSLPPELRETRYLRAQYLPHPEEKSVHAAFFALTREIQALDDGHCHEVKGVAPLGPSGSGKTTLTRQLPVWFPHLTDWTHADEGGSLKVTPVLRVRLQGSVNRRGFFKAALEALNVPVRPKGDTADDLYIALVRLCRVRGVRVIVVEEVQHALGDRADDKVHANTLKNLLDDERYPIALVLVGTPEVAPWLETVDAASLGEDTVRDGHNARRFYRVALRAMPHEVGTALAANLIEKGCGLADLTVGRSVVRRQAAARVAHVTNGRFGALVEAVDRALTEAVDDGSDTLEIGHFARSHATKTGSHRDDNAFLIDGWDRTGPAL